MLVKRRKPTKSMSVARDQFKLINHMPKKVVIRVGARGPRANSIMAYMSGTPARIPKPHMSESAVGCFTRNLAPITAPIMTPSNPVTTVITPNSNDTLRDLKFRSFQFLRNQLQYYPLSSSLASSVVPSCAISPKVMNLGPQDPRAPAKKATAMVAIVR